MSESSGEEDLQGLLAPVVSISAELKNLENEKTKMENCIQKLSAKRQDGEVKELKD